MLQLDQSLVLIMAGVIAVLAVLATVIYYFARYFFVTHDKDKETYTHSISLVDDKLGVGTKIKSDSQSSNTQFVSNQHQQSDSKLSGNQHLGSKSTNYNTVSLNTQSTQTEATNLKTSLVNTRENIWGRIKRSLTFGDNLGSIDKDILEEILYTSDMGTTTVQALMEQLSDDIKKSSSGSAIDALKQLLKNKMSEMLGDSPKNTSHLWADSSTSGEKNPVVWMVVGVNGAGKTTTIGKLARFAVSKGKNVLVVPGDTFRAAAADQLKVWADRVNAIQNTSGRAQFFEAKTTDPSGMAYEGAMYAKNNNFDLVIVDTAGRLHTQQPLMEELKKIKRVIGQVIPNSPQQTLIVLDSNSGQNALAQAVAFNNAIQLSGVIMTKLDGTAKGGVVLGVVNETHLPILFVGIGEKIEDLKEFNPSEFVDSIFN